MSSKLCRVIAFLATGFFSLPYANGNEMDINQAIPSQGTGVTFIDGQNFSNKKVVYEKKNGLAILEGDILIGTMEEAEARYNASIGNSKPLYSVIISGNNRRWVNNIVPFQFDQGVSLIVQQHVNNAIAHWHLRTDVEFVLRTPQNANQFPDFVRIINRAGDGCWSQVGRRGGRQDLNLQDNCGFGAAIHELGHVLGLWHEQSREDRDSFVRINWENIEPEREHNFDQHIRDGDDINGYDYGSIMHYGRRAFTRNGLDTIMPLQPNVTIGQRNALSTGDIASINMHYPPVVPIARLDREVYSVFLGTAAFIDGSTSFDPNGGALSFNWNLGDGTAFSNQNNSVIHTYASRGNFNIQLTVVDPQGFMANDTARAVVYGSEVLVPILSLLN